ncbi:hypothetical protein ERJ75_000308500 [Trypanosoma vivax]|nr:hypothetical protein ERJ75_000308500 [Trypanosoma vivax]
MSDFYSGLALLQNEADIQSYLMASSCGRHCINEIATAARLLLGAFKGSYWKWKNCADSNYDGCCLGNDRKSQWNGKSPGLLWVNCFSPDPSAVAEYENRVSNFVSMFISDGAKKNKWLKCVRLTLERDSKKCRYTTSDYSSWSTEIGTFGGLFYVEYDHYYHTTMLKLTQTEYDSWSFHTLLCMLRCSGYVSKLSIVNCDDKCVGDNVQVPEAQNVEP